MKQEFVSKKISEISKLNEENKIHYYLENNVGQKIERKDRWELEEKSLLIHSIINNMILPQLYVYLNDENYYIIDGSKRLSTILDFINSKFAININCYDDFGINLRDKTFYSLSTKLQHKILNYQINIVEQTGTTNEAIDTFIRCNNGIPVKPIEVFRAKMGDHLSLLNEICNHNIFSLLELGGSNNFRNYEMALYFLMLEANPGLGLAKKEKEEFVNQISTVKNFNNKIKLNIFKKLDYLFESFHKHEYNDLEKYDKYLKKSHILILYRLSKDAIEKKITTEDFFEWANEFFNLSKNPRSLYWIESSRGSTTAKSSLDIRYQELKYNFDVYFSEYNCSLSIAK